MDFDKQIAALLDKELSRNVRVVGGAVLMLQKAVVDGANGLPGTPRDTELAASNWFVEVDGSSNKVSSDTSRANLPLAQSAVAVALGRKQTLKYFSIFNNLPYIRHLEYGLYPNPPKNKTGKTLNGYSTQAPQGMLRVALQQWESILAQAAQEK